MLITKIFKQNSNQNSKVQTKKINLKNYYKYNFTKYKNLLSNKKNLLFTLITYYQLNLTLNRYQNLILNLN